MPLRAVPPAQVSRDFPEKFFTMSPKPLIATSFATSPATSPAARAEQEAVSMILLSVVVELFEAVGAWNGVPFTAQYSFKSVMSQAGFPVNSMSISPSGEAASVLLVLAPACAFVLTAVSLTMFEHEASKNASSVLAAMHCDFFIFLPLLINLIVSFFIATRALF